MTIQPSVLISEPSSDVSFTCNTTAGPNNRFAWFYNATSVVCDDCTETVEDFLSRKYWSIKRVGKFERERKQQEKWSMIEVII